METLKTITFLENNNKTFNKTNFNSNKVQISQKIKNQNNINIEKYILKYFVYGFQNILLKYNKDFLTNTGIDEIKIISEYWVKLDINKNNSCFSF